MKKFSILSLGIIATMGFAMQSCSEEIIDYNEQQNEKYVKDFIQQFGKPDPNHTYSMAKAASVTVTTDHPTNVYVTSNIDGTNYCFAQYPELDGTATMQFDIPKDIKYVNVETEDGITIVPVGGTANLAHAKSRAEITPETSFTLPLTTSPVDYTTFAVDLDKTRYMSQTELPAWADKGMAFWSKATIDKMVGAEYKQYTNPDITNDATATNRQYIWNGTNEYIIALSVKHIKVDGEYKNFEIGRVYGNKQSLAASTEFTLVPMYQTNYSNSSNNPTQLIGKYNLPTSDLEEWTHTVVLDYDSRHISIEGTDASNYGWFKYLFDNTYLLTKLENAVQHPLPKPEDWYYTTPTSQDRHELPLYPTDESDDAGKLAFFNAWDQFIQDWLDDNPDEKEFHDELLEIKTLLATESRGTAAGALPNVTKEGNTYYIKYYTSRYLHTSYGSRVDEDGVCRDFEDQDVLYFVSTNALCWASEKENMPRTGSEYAIYMRPKGDNNPAHIVTTLDGRLKSVRRHMPFTSPNLYQNSTTEPEYLYLDYDGDGDYTDFVFRVEGSEYSNYAGYTWMLACEDLGTVGDYDFNDMVVGFDVRSYGQTAQEISVRPMAAGGVYPLYLMWNDLTQNEVYVVGQEIHKWLGQSELVPFNTEGEYQGVNGKTVDFDYNVTDHDNVRFSFDSDLNKYFNGGAMQGFWVLVDKNNVLASYENDLVAGGFQNKSLNKVDKDQLDAFIEANKDKGLYKVSNDGSSVAPVAKMIFVDNRWEWPEERTDIRTAYPLFRTWVNDMNTKWYPIENNAHTIKRE